MAFNFRWLTRSTGGQTGEAAPLSESTAYQEQWLGSGYFKDLSLCVFSTKHTSAALLTCIGVVGNECFLCVHSLFLQNRTYVKTKWLNLLNYSFIYATFEYK